MRIIKGLTLFEVLISIVIIAISVLSIALMFQQALRGGPAVRNLTIATALAEKTMEEALEKGLNISNYSGNFSEFPSFNYTVVAYNVTQEDLDTLVEQDSEYRHIKVMVSYPADSPGSSNIILNSLFTNYTN